MISHRYNTIFIHITKCAGKSVEHAFGLDVKAWHRNPSCVKHGTPQQWEYPKHWHDFFTFTIIRNPLSRAVSAFFFDYGRRNRRDRQTRVCLESTGGDFRVFVRDHLMAFANARSIFREQSYWLHAEYDYIATVETLTDDWAVIQDRIGLNEPLPHANKSAHDYWQTYYDDATEAGVRKVYANDYEKLEEWYK